MSVYSEIKKYLLFLVGFFCLVLGAHLIILYFYSDAETYPIRGGTLNIGVVGKQPAIDVLSTDTKIENNSGDTVMRFLYRGLVRYSIQEKKIVGDLASCGLDTFPTIRCTLTQDALWSDGSTVTIDDIVSSYAFFRENARNENTKSRLGLITVQEDRGDVVFRFRSNDATLIDTLFLPVISKKDIVSFDTLDMSKKLFSGPYVFHSIEDKKETILLKYNPYFKSEQNTHYFDQIRFGFGETLDEVNSTINPDILISDTPEGPGEKNKYERPLIYGIFLNSSRVPNTLRTAIFNDIFEQIPIALDDNLYKKERSIFLGEIPVETKKSVETLFQKAATSLGYSLGGTVPVSTETTPTVNPEKPLKYITKPTKSTPAFSSEETIEISGSVPTGTIKVLVNDYALQNFVASRKQFLYYAKKEFKNLAPGANVYKIVFYGGQKVLASEDITIYHNTNTAELEKMKKEWLQSNQPEKKPEPVVQNTNLDPKKLYKNGEPLTIKIVMQDEVPFFPDIAENIKQKLETLGVTVELTTLPLADIKKSLSDPKFSYDIFLTGINLGLFHYNILPFFHSGQVKEGYNISQIRNPSLDSIMERMTEQLYYSAPDKLRNYETNAAKILDQEAVFFGIASPYEFFHARKTVLGLSIPEFLSGREALVDILAKTYIKEGYRRSEESKTIPGFFVWLKNELFSNL